MKTYLLCISKSKNSFVDSRDFKGLPMFSHYQSLRQREGREKDLHRPERPRGEGEGGLANNFPQNNGVWGENE